ncbi:MAG: ferritin-like domain-containing protein [Ilumatobacteraceae bacterium]|nr:ferritin-like domain-containing protein [Actinomycetota bacterium]MDA2974217.1 ferritin-like domain-containing protein [Actinomycetota bacterium]MDA3009675.1 ferritin-like domain-containing protein [Actinomycetota bacterium]
MNDAPRGIDNLDEATETGARDRRTMLVAGLAGAVAAIAGASKVSAAENDFTAAELDILRFAQRLELTARDLYDAAMAAGATGAIWEAMSEQHEAYAQSIAGLTGLSADSRNDEVFDALVGAFSSSDAAEAAYDLESAAAATHIEVLGLLTHRPASQLVASIISAESRHCVVLADLTGRGTDLTALLVNDAQPILPA